MSRPDPVPAGTSPHAGAGRPYADFGDIQLWHGDCREILPTLPRRSVDLIVTDPPYGASWRSGRRTRQRDRISNDDHRADALARDAVAAALGVLRDFRHLYVFGEPDLTGLPIGPVERISWDKAIIGPGDLTLPWGPQWEPITFAVQVTRPSNRARGDGRLAARLRRGAVVRVPRDNSAQVHDDAHATPKPVMLLRQLIESSSIMGETVLDPFAGHGPTLVAARLEGRSAIGIELEEANCEAIARRLEATDGCERCATRRPPRARRPGQGVLDLGGVTA